MEIETLNKAYKMHSQIKELLNMKYRLIHTNIIQDIVIFKSDTHPDIPNNIKEETKIVIKNAVLEIVKKIDFEIDKLSLEIKKL
jgi:hypothetical protein